MYVYILYKHQQSEGEERRVFCVACILSGPSDPTVPSSTRHCTGEMEKEAEEEEEEEEEESQNRQLELDPRLERKSL